MIPLKLVTKKKNAISMSLVVEFKVKTAMVKTLLRVLMSTAYKRNLESDVPLKMVSYNSSCVKFMHRLTSVSKAKKRMQELVINMATSLGVWWKKESLRRRMIYAVRKMKTRTMREIDTLVILLIYLHPAKISPLNISLAASIFLSLSSLAHLKQ